MDFLSIVKTSAIKQQDTITIFMNNLCTVLKDGRRDVQFPSRHIVGLYFFEKDGNTATMNADRYIQMYNNFLKPGSHRKMHSVPLQNI